MGILCVRPTKSGAAARYQPSDAESLREMTTQRSAYALKTSNALADKIITVPIQGGQNAEPHGAQ